MFVRIAVLRVIRVLYKYRRTEQTTAKIYGCDNTRITSAYWIYWPLMHTFRKPK
jgi:hypothetical protein